MCCHDSLHNRQDAVILDYQNSDVQLCQSNSSVTHMEADIYSSRSLPPSGLTLTRKAKWSMAITVLAS